jgi:2-polyprenyl-3-methyl-5-hydroxy-6-metoxy-1,4-benzoquinol methylase
VKYKECGLVWIPEPSAPSYEDEYYFFDPKHDKQQERRAKFFFEVVRSESPSSGIRLLDVGCGTGQFVSLCGQYGWAAAGTDVSNLAISICRERRTGEFLHFSDVTDLVRHFEAESFDAVTLWEVIEHVMEPLEYLEILVRLLKPKGKLFISTPNVDSLYSKILGNKWHGFQGEIRQYHIRYFNMKSLLFLMNQAGLQVERLTTVCPPAQPILIPRNLSHKLIPNIRSAPLRRGLRGLMTLGLVPLVMVMHRFANPRGNGDTLIAVGSKEVDWSMEII